MPGLDLTPYTTHSSLMASVRAAPPNNPFTDPQHRKQNLRSRVSNIIQHFPTILATPKRCDNSGHCRCNCEELHAEMEVMMADMTDRIIAEMQGMEERLIAQMTASSNQIIEEMTSVKKALEQIHEVLEVVDKTMTTVAAAANDRGRLIEADSEMAALTITAETRDNVTGADDVEITKYI